MHCKILCDIIRHRKAGDNRMDVGQLIKDRRLAKGMTQEELADLVGVKKSAVAKWENGRVSEIKRSNLKMLADALEVSPVQLLGDIEKRPVSVAQELAEIYHDSDLRKMIAEYQKLPVQKQEQVKEFIRFLSKQD